MIVIRSKAEVHATKECLKRIIACSYCKIDKKFDQMVQHLNTECLEFPVPCTDCEKPIERKNLLSHSHECPEKVIGCHIIGCTHTHRRKDSTMHLHTSNNDHLDLINNAISMFYLMCPGDLSFFLLIFMY